MADGSKKRLVAAVLIVVGALLWLRVPERAEIRNVVLISLDTTRADHLGCYGHAGGITPNIDALAGEGVLFEHVVAAAPLTLPSHATMLTGTLPPNHGIRDNLFLGLDPGIETLAETLKRHGFATGAVVSAVVLHRIYGLDQGFDSYDDRLGVPGPAAEQTGDAATAKAIEWIKGRGGERFFLFLHYFDPHDEYAPPEPFASRFAGDPYAGEIAFTDHCVGEVVAALKAQGLDDSTLIVIAGDHGEMLGSHGEATHGFFVYEPALRVPLIFRPPGAGDRPPRRVAANAGVVDVTPTICGLLGIDPPSPVQGRDLAALVRAGAPPRDERFVYSESLTATKYGANGLRALTGTRWKYIETTRPELYDLAADPAERNNVLADHADVAAALRDRLAEIGAGLGPGPAPASPDEQTLARLRSLGYVSGAVEPRAGPDPGRDDPKDLVELHNRFSEVEVLLARGDPDRAAVIGAGLAEERPDVPLLRQTLGRIALAQGRYEDAVGHCRAALALDAEQFTAARTLGAALAALGRLDEAIDAYRQAVAIRPNEPRAHYQLAHLYDRRGDVSLALEHLRESARLNPDAPAVYTALGRLHLEQGRRDEAIEAFTRALELRPGYPPYLELLEEARRRGGGA